MTITNSDRTCFWSPTRWLDAVGRAASNADATQVVERLQWYTVADLAELEGVSTRTIYRRLKRGDVEKRETDAGTRYRPATKTTYDDTDTRSLPWQARVLADELRRRSIHSTSPSRPPLPLVWHSVDELADLIGCSVPTVRKQRNALIEAGFLYTLDRSCSHSFLRVLKHPSTSIPDSLDAVLPLLCRHFDLDDSDIPTWVLPVLVRGYRRHKSNLSIS